MADAVEAEQRQVSSAISHVDFNEFVVQEQPLARQAELITIGINQARRDEQDSIDITDKTMVENVIDSLIEKSLDLVNLKMATSFAVQDVLQNLVEHEVAQMCASVAEVLRVHRRLRRSLDAIRACSNQMSVLLLASAGSRKWSLLCPGALS